MRASNWQPLWWGELLFHLPPPWSPCGNRSLRLWESRSPWRQSGDSVSAGDRFFSPGSNWDSWHGTEVLLLNPFQRTQVNQPWRYSRSHRGSQGQQSSSPERYPEQGLEASSPASVSLLAQIFNAVLRTHHFLQVWKKALVISILKPGNDQALPSSYRPISLLDTIGKLFEKILLARILHVVSERGLMRDEQIGCRPTHSTSLQLVHLVERITRNFGEKRLTGPVFLDVAKILRYRLDR